MSLSIMEAHKELNLVVNEMISQVRNQKIIITITFTFSLIFASFMWNIIQSLFRPLKILHMKQSTKGKLNFDWTANNL